MAMRTRLTIWLAVVALGAAGCKVPTAGRPAMGGASAKPPASAAPRASVGPQASVAPGVAVAIQADGLKGRVVAPAAMVAAGAGNMVAAGAGNMVAAGAGNLISEDGSTLVAAGAENYGVLAVEQRALVGARVALLDAAGAPVRGRDGKPLEATTDAAGAYAFPTGVPARGVRVVVDLGRAGSLQAIAPKGRVAGDVDVDVVSTLAGGYVVNQYVRPQADPNATLDRLPPDAEAETRARAAAALDAGKVPLPVRLDATAVDATVTSLRQADARLDAQLEVVRKLLVIGAESAAATDGAARTAAIAPLGLAVDPATGDAYFTDQHLVRKLTADGRVVTLAGSGQPGARDGKGLEASFVYPTSLAVGADGRVLVADTGAYKIRAIAPDGTVTTLAGTGASGAADGPAAAATFFNPSGTVVAPDGTVFVADWLNHKIRKIAKDGAVSTFAGTGTAGDADGPAAAATLNGPRGLAIDAAGNLYVTQNDSPAIRKVAPDGTVSTVVRAADAAYWPSGPITIGADGVLCFTHAFGVARARTSTGSGMLPFVGGDVAGRADGAGADARFSYPAGLAALPGGDLLVADTENNLIRRVTPAGVVTTVAGTGRREAAGSAATAVLTYVNGVAGAPDGTLVVADSGSWTIRRVSPEGTVTALAGTGQQGAADGPGATAAFSGPQGLAFDAAGDLLVADAYNHAIRKIGMADPTHPVTTLHGGPADEDWFPGAIVHDPARGLIVADNRLIEVLAADGSRRVLAGGAEGYVDGKGAAARFSGINGLAMDAAGNLYVAEATNTTIRKVAPDGTTTTVAGRAWTEGAPTAARDGRGPEAIFSQPYGIAIDAAGNLYVADLGTGVRRVTPAGEVTTLKLELPAGAELNGAIAVVGGDLVYSTSAQVFRVPLPR